jgi:hypothetical protein
LSEIEKAQEKSPALHRNLRKNKKSPSGSQMAVTWAILESV